MSLASVLNTTSDARNTAEHRPHGHAGAALGAWRDTT